MEKEILKVKLKEALDLLSSLPSNRKIFYNTGILSIEVSKEEAKKLIQKKLKEIGKESRNG